MAARGARAAGERMRRIGVLMTQCRRRSGSAGSHAAFLQGLQQARLGRRPQCADRLSLGGRRCRPHSPARGGVGCARAGRHPGQRRRQSWRPLQQATRTDPDRVRADRRDPVGAGFVDSLARPGGNVTGFTQFEYRHERKMAGAAQARLPRASTRVAVLRDPDQSPPAIGQLAAIQAAAPSLGMEVSSGQRARRRRDRARRRSVRARRRTAA